MEMRGIARDFLALGGLPFFILVLARVWILDNPGYLMQFVVAGVLFIILALVFRVNFYPGLALVVLVFTSMHYNDTRFTVLAILAYVGLLVSAVYLKEDTKKLIFGILLGAISSGAAWIIL